MTTELLPATFASEAEADRWASRIKHPVVAIEPSQDSPGRFQVRIQRATKKEQS